VLEPGELFVENTGDEKYRDTVPLNQNILLFYSVHTQNIYKKSKHMKSLLRPLIPHFRIWSTECYRDENPTQYLHRLHNHRRNRA
jgi:hypothetical protein